MTCYVKWRLKLNTELNKVVVLIKDEIRGNFEYDKAVFGDEGVELENGVFLPYAIYDTHIVYPTIEHLKHTGKLKADIEVNELAYVHEIICSYLCKRSKIVKNMLILNEERLKEKYGEYEVDTENILKQLKLDNSYS